MTDVGRRRFLVYAVAAPAAGVAARFGIDGLLSSASAEPEAPDLTDLIVLAASPTAHDLVIEIRSDNTVFVDLPRIEIGQGVTTTMAMLVAEELDARLDDVDVQLQDARPANQLNQATGGSTSVVVLYEPIRSVAAEIRARLVTAAAQAWDLPAASLRTRDTAVHAPDGRSLTYAELAAAAAEVEEPEVSGAPRSPDAFRLIGRPTKRVDARDLVTGRAHFTLDIPVPGAKAAVVAHPPTISGTVASVDDRAARAVAGVFAVVPVPTGVAVVAEDFHAALTGRDALRVTWDPGPLAGVSDEEVFARLRSAAPPFLAPPVTVPGGLARTIERSFDFAFLSHGPLETLVAVADVRADRAEVWCPSQMPIHAQSQVAEVVGLPVDAVTVHVVRAGGSFGRKLFPDAAVEAATISKAAGLPVRLLTTRADDMQHGRLRPASHHRIRATLVGAQVRSYEHRAATTTLDLDHGFGDFVSATMASTLPLSYGYMVFGTAAGTPYEFGVEDYLLGEVPLAVPSGSWRSIYSGTASVSNEIVVDELARLVGEDPIAFRMARLSDARDRAVLATMRDAGGWGPPAPPGCGRGVALHREYRSTVAYLVDLDARDPTAPRVTRVVVAADVGRCINPTGLEAQLIGCAMDGISATLHAGNHLVDGAIRETSYGDFRWARMRNSPPAVEVHILPPTTGSPGGAGELGFPAAAAAVANAHGAATGVVPGRFPIVDPEV